jgi:uncharacterized membrane protein
VDRAAGYSATAQRFVRRRTVAEDGMKEFLKTTIVGGVIFLLPVGLVIFLLGHAFAFAAKLIAPISKHLHLDQISGVTGISLVSILSIASLVIVSFLAGLVARTALGARMTYWFEHSLLGRFPQYRMAKSIAEGFANAERATDAMRPALINVDCGWQLGYVLETLDNGWLAVFLPQVPTPMSGNIMYVPAECVRALDMTMTQATTLVKRAGIGSREMLGGVDLMPAAGR